MPRVTIAIANYNNGPFLAETLDSMLAQTYDDFDIVVVDDASSDDSVQVLEKYSGKVRWFRHETNQGSAAAWNTAIKRSEGDLVAIAASDDPWLPDCLETEVPVFAAHPEAGLVYARAVTVDERGVPRAERKKKKRSRAEGWVLPRLFMEENFASTALIRREAIERAGYFDESFRLAQDYELYLRVAFHYPFAQVDRALKHYRKHPGSVTTGKRHRAFPFQRAAVEKVWKNFGEVDGPGGAANRITRALYDERRVYQCVKEARYWLRHEDPAQASRVLREARKLRPADPNLLWLSFRARLRMKSAS